MISARSERDRPPVGPLLTALIVLLPVVAAGIAIPLVTPGTTLEVEVALVGGTVGFAIFYRFVRSELTLVSAFGSYLIVLSSLFVTFGNLRVFYQPTSQLPSATLSDLLLLAGGVVLAGAALVEHHAVPLYSLPLVVGSGMLTFAVAATLLVPGSTGRSSDGLLFLVGVVATPLVVAAGARARTALVVIMLFWLVSGAINGAVAFLDVAQLTSIGALVAGRAISLSTDPNALGISCAMLVPVGMAFFLAWRNVLFRLLVTVLTVCTAVGVVVSGSRAATLAALFGLLIVPVLSYRRRFQAVLLSVAVLVGAGVVYIVSSQFFVSIQRLTGQLPVEASDAARLDAWQAALGQISSSPLIGSGFSSIVVAHDLALQLLVSGGVIALLGYALFAGGVLRLGVRYSRARELDRQVSILSAGLTASVLLFLVYGAVANEIFNRFLYWPFGLLVAIAFISRRAAPAPAPPESTAKEATPAHTGMMLPEGGRTSPR